MGDLVHSGSVDRSIEPKAHIAQDGRSKLSTWRASLLAQIVGYSCKFPIMAQFIQCRQF